MTHDTELTEWMPRTMTAAVIQHEGGATEYSQLTLESADTLFILSSLPFSAVSHIRIKPVVQDTLNILTKVSVYSSQYNTLLRY